MICKLIDKLRLPGLALLFLFIGLCSFGEEKVFPDKPNPPRLVNDFANMMSASEQAQLEQKLLEFERSTSIEITVVTITTLHDYDVSDFAIKLGKAWGVGKSGKNDGVVVLASLQEHKINISTGKGMEGALTDLMCGRIIRNEMTPAFKSGYYFQGFSKAADAIIAAAKGEYKADKSEKKRHIPFTALIIAGIFLFFILRMFRGGGGGGNYMSGRGFGGFTAGMILGSLLGGSGRGGDWGGSGGGGGDSGFGGFGGGDFGGGGASGSW